MRKIRTLLVCAIAAALMPVCGVAAASAGDVQVPVLMVNAGMSQGDAVWAMEADRGSGRVYLARVVPGKVGRNQLWQMRPHPFPAGHPFDGIQIVNVGTGQCLGDDGQFDRQQLMLVDCSFTYVNGWSWPLTAGEPAPGPMMLWSAFTSRTPVPVANGDAVHEIRQLSGTDASAFGNLARWRTVRG